MFQYLDIRGINVPFLLEVFNAVIHELKWWPGNHKHVVGVLVFYLVNTLEMFYTLYMLIQSL